MERRTCVERAEMTAEPADIALLACVLHGDQTGLAGLLNRHWQSLVRYSFTILEDWDAAEDVAEEVFVKLWEHRESWGLEGSVKGLLFRIARNLSLDEQRQRNACQRAATKVATHARSLSPIEYVEANDLNQILIAALEKLPRRRREVFVLVRQHGMSYREAADALELAPQTVANHLSAALAELRDALEPHVRDRPAESVSSSERSSAKCVGAATGR